MKRKKMNCIWRITASVLASVLLIGCAASQRDPSEDKMESNAVANMAPTDTPVALSATPLPPATPTVTASYTPTSEPSVTPSSTSTITPSNTLTATSTPAPTLTPLPTIPPQQRGELYAELMSSNGDCALPCWWGFELGKLSLDEVRQFYLAFGAYVSEQHGSNGISVLYAQFVDPQIENGEQVRHTFVAQDNVIVDIEIQLKSRPEYQVGTILERLGRPFEVWLWTIPEPREGILPADFLLYFPEQGVLVGYRTGAVKVGDAVNVCFDEPGGATILLWNPAVWNSNGNKGFIERTNESSELTIEGHRPLEEVSNWDVEQFYTILTDPTRAECLETPSNLWVAP
jgi:hypothetical protein